MTGRISIVWLISVCIVAAVQADTIKFDPNNFVSPWAREKHPYVRVTEPGELSPGGRWLPVPGPVSPDQETLRLMATDPLTIVVPGVGWQSGSLSFGLSARELRQDGNRFELDFFYALMGFTGTWIGDPIYLEWHQPIGRLAAGEYELQTRYFTIATVAIQSEESFAEFRADPFGFADAHGSSCQVTVAEISFNVVPEPTAGLLALFLWASLLLAWFFRRTPSTPGCA
jgi:hypothetical protein